jgi:biofilm PGA synthesis protein PgaA
MRNPLLSLLIPAVVLAVLIYEILTTPIYSDREISAMREAAVRRAEAGEVEQALEQLQALVAVAPDDRAAWGDYLTVLVRHGRADEAITLANGSPDRALPDYALFELFTAALARGDLASARQFADREIAQSNDAAAVARAREQALASAEAAPAADAGLLQSEAPQPASDEASSIADTVVPEAETSGDESVEIAVTVSPRPAPGRRHAPAAARRDAAPLAQSVAVVEPTPPSMETAPPAGGAVAAAPLPETPVSKTAVSETSVSETSVSEPSLAEQARAAVRVAEQASPAERVERAREAVMLTRRYWQAQLESDEASDSERRNAALDHVRALTLAGELDAAAVLFASLDEASLPRFGLLYGADLYALRREPEQVERLLDRAEVLEPGASDIQVSRFYNQLDLERYANAEATLAQLRASARTPADQRDAQLLSAMFAAYDNRLDDAQRQLEQLQRQYPTDVGIALRRAQIYRWRGWPQRALETYTNLLPIADDTAAVRAGMAVTATAANDFGTARELRQQLERAAPAHPDVVAIGRDERQRRLAEYRARVVVGDSAQSSGLQSVNGDGEIGFEQQLYSAPLADSYRLFASHRYDWADLPEGAGSANRLSAGGEYRSRWLDLSAELTHRAPGSHLGARLRGEWRLDDHWSFYSDLESDSSGVPLRALRQGVDGESVAVGARHRFSESRDLRLGIGRIDFSDGNIRDTASASYRHALHNSAHHQLSVTGQLYYSANSAGSDVPYFNPDSDLAAGATFEYVGVLSRRFERSWSHRIAIGIAHYEQQHYDAGGIWDVEYEQRWRLSPQFAVNGGLLYRSRIYDGAREGYGALFAGLEWRF